MARLDNVLPSVIGQPREGHLVMQHPGLSAHGGGTLAAYGGIAGQAGNDLLKAFKTLTALGREGQDLALARARADYEKEVQEQLDAQVYSLNGEQAGNAGAKAEEIMRAAADRQLEKLSEYGVRPSRDFRNFAVRSSASQVVRATEYGRRETRKAAIAATNDTMTMLAKTYAQTGGDGLIGQVEGLYQEAFTAANGRRVTQDDLDAYRKSLDEGYVNFNGKRLKVVDEVKEGDGPGVIAKATAEQAFESLTREKEAYDRGWQRQKDLLHSSRIDALLKEDDLGGAEAYYANHADDMSGEIRPLVEKSLNTYKNVRNFQRETNALTAEVLARVDALPGTDGGRYWTNEAEKTAADTLTEMSKAVRESENPERARMLFDAVNNALRQRKELGMRALNADIQAQYKAFSDEGLFDDLSRNDEFTAKVQRMPDTPLRDYFMDMQAKRALTLQKERDAAGKERGKEAPSPEERIAQEARVQEAMKLCLTEGTYYGKQSDGSVIRYELSREEDRQRLYVDFNLSDADIARVTYFLEHKKEMGPPGLAERLTVSVLNELGTTENFTEANVNYLAPQLVDKARYLILLQPRKANGSSDADEKVVLNELRKFLLAVQQNNGGFFSGDENLAQYLNRAFDKYGNITDREITEKGFYQLTLSKEDMEFLANWKRRVDAEYTQGKIRFVPVSTTAAELFAKENYGQTPISDANGRMVFVPEDEAEEKEKEVEDADRFIESRKWQSLYNSQGIR